MAGIRASPSLHRVQLVAVRIGVLVGPRVDILERDGVDHERVAVPASDLFAEVQRVRIVGVLAPICRN